MIDIFELFGIDDLEEELNEEGRTIQYVCIGDQWYDNEGNEIDTPEEYKRSLH